MSKIVSGPTRRRLLVLSTEFPPGPGGIGTHAWELSRHLHGFGWSVHVVARQDYATDTEIQTFNRCAPFEISPLSSARRNPLQMLRRWGDLSRLISGLQPDLVLASGSRAVWLATLLARRHSLPWVAVGHGTEFGERHPLRRLLTRWAFEQASAVVCVSEFTQARMRAADILPRRSAVIPNGADASRFGLLPRAVVDEVRERLGLADANLLLTVGNVTERKGQEVVIRALPLVLERFPDTHYLAAGLPTEASKLSELAHELGVADHVHFLGRVDNETVVEVLNACDIFVMTSRYTDDGDFEGYGIAVVEAALCGKPAVVSKDSGLAEAIVDGETGLGVPENDPPATAMAIVSLLSDPAQRQRMGKAARHRALAEQTWENRVRHYDRFLRAVASGSDSASVSTLDEKGGQQ